MRAHTDSYYVQQCQRRRLAQGLCRVPGCGEERVNGSHCEPHRLAHNAALIERRARRARGDTADRRRRGAAHHATRFDDATVREIRRRLRDGGRGTLTALAREHGVSVEMLSRLARGVTYRHVPDEPETGTRGGAADG